jgi:hypothetical protein
MTGPSIPATLLNSRVVAEVVAPDEVIRCPHPRRPSGLVWEDLTAEKIAAIPVLAQRRPL